MKQRSFLYASLLLAVLSVAGCGGSGGGGGGDGGGETSTPTATPTPTPTPTAVGVPIGNAVSATIGATGGSVSTPDGKIALSIPAGALAADTVISIQPLTNMAHGKIGAAYRLTPDGQIFLTPVTLTFAYTDEDLAGTAADFLGAAFQTADGYWQWAGDVTLDTTAKTVSVSASHFSDWSNVRGLQIRPPKKTVRPNGSVGLQVKVCYPVSYDGGLASLASDCDATGQGIVATLSIDEWSVNSREGGGDIFGTVSGRGATATYMAPATVPIPNTVAVSARVHNPKKGPTAKTLVVSNITIADESWTGTATNVFVDPEVGVVITVTANVTWTLESTNNKVATYVPTGTVTDTVGRFGECTASFDPSSHAIDPSIDGTLTIDNNFDPPTYRGHGQSNWIATLTVTCPTNSGGNNEMFAGGAFFGGNGGEATGTVSPDGMTIQGSDTYTVAEGLTFNFNWEFTRDQ